MIFDHPKAAHSKSVKRNTALEILQEILFAQSSVKRFKTINDYLYQSLV